MGKKDIMDKDYFSEPEKLAELIQNGVYHGRIHIKGKNLKRLNQKYSTLNGKNGELERDGIFLEEEYGIKYGLEIENYADYSMPRRVMTYDACEYERDASKLREEHDIIKDFKTFEEKKSGMKKGEGYLPVITLVLYLGQGHFMGNCTLKDCLQIKNKARKYVYDKIQNYSFPIIEADYVNPLDYKTELREFFQAMQCRYDKEKLLKLFEEERFENITANTQRIIAIHLDMDKLIKKVVEEEENMCKALRDLMKDTREEGREEERELVAMKMVEANKPVEEIMKFTTLSREEVLKLCEK